MAKKLTIEFVREAFEGEGYTLVTSEYVNNASKLEYICPEDHTGSIRWNDWHGGHRCAECSGSKRLTIDFIKKEFKKDGYTLLTKEYTGNKRKLEYTCPKGHCGSIMWNNWQQGARCQKCYLENNKGKNHPNWNPNKTDEERNDDRKYLEYIEWRKLVYERDNYTCQICGDKKGGNLNAHHIEAYASNKELRTDLDNGICLCEKCHKEFHHKYGRGNNTRKQFEEFIEFKGNNK